MKMLSRSLGLIALAALLAFGSAPAPATAQVNPTELAVHEDALLDALGRGEVVGGRVSIPNDRAADLIKPGGRDWQSLHSGTMFALSVWAPLAVLGVLVLYYLMRGPIRIDGGRSGRTILRFTGIERFAHWLMAVPFVILALTGLNLVIGAAVIRPLIGAEAFASLTAWGKLAHNFLAWPFMVGVLLTALVWIRDNMPTSVDAQWLAQGGGMFSKGVHPPAWKFNAGQKILFWLVIAGSVVLSVTGLVLLFPNVIDTSATWQLSQILHGVAAAVLSAVIIAHIYLGSIGMEGAFDAISSGEVDANWAHEHHSLWAAEADGSGARHAAPGKGHVAPAE